MNAYCFATGQIEFGHFIPEGALPIAKGPARELQDFISGVAERSRYQRDMLLVPGFRCDSYGQPLQHENMDKLTDWLDWIKAGAPADVSVFRSAANTSLRRSTASKAGRKSRRTSVVA